MMLLLLPHALACVLDPGLPVNLTAHADVQPLCAGFIDASTAPYGAAGDGVQDDTVALQAALDDAYAFQLAVLLPAGRTFLVNRQLRLVQNGRPPSMRDYGFQLVGARGSTPPTIKVRDDADAAAFPRLGTGGSASINGTIFEARPLLYFDLINNPPGSGNRSDAPSLYSALLRNVHIDLGRNAMLSGVAMSGAQLCSIEDVYIHGTEFTSGVVGLPGSGGFSANVRVVGGCFAVWQAEFRPNPSISGLIAVNQSVAAVFLQDARGPLVLSGFVMRSAVAKAAVLVQATDAQAGTGDVSLAMEDGSIELTAQAATVAIAGSGCDITLRSVWFKCAIVAAFPTLQLVIPGDPLRHRRIATWAFAGGRRGTSRTSIAYSAGKNTSAAAASTGVPDLGPFLSVAKASSPPPDVQFETMHSWQRATSQAMAWSPQASLMLDAVRDCGATPHWVNDTDDDGAAIARCLDQGGANATVFIPRGQYLVWQSLVLRPGQVLLGSGKHCAKLVMRSPWPEPAAPVLLLEQADGGHTSDGISQSQGIGVIVSDLVLVVSQRSPALGVRSGGDTLVRDLRTVPCSLWKKTDQPRCSNHTIPTLAADGMAMAGVIFSAAASGRFFGLSLDHFSTFLLPHDALLIVNNTKNNDRGGNNSGIHIYQLSAEHLATDYQVQVWRSAHVHFHAFKFESAGFRAHPSWGPDGGGLFSCHGSTDISVFGGSGNFGVMNASLARDIFFAWGCKNLAIHAVVRKPQEGETPASGANWIRSVTNTTYNAAVALPSLPYEYVVISDGNPSLLLFTSDSA